MIDHVLGRPSVKFRKIQVLTVVSFWSFYLCKGNRHGPPILRKISRPFAKFFTPWQTMVLTLLYLYIARNLGKLLNLESPEPLANLYNRSYFRATWVMTAMDAGFWSAMRIKNQALRDIASIIFTGYYLIAAEQADEKVRKVRAMLTVEHMRVSWNKGTTPYLHGLQKLLRPRFMRYPPRQIRIARPPGSDYTETVMAWLYYDAPVSTLQNYTKVVLDIPGGGFVAMDPRTNDDRLMAWAGKTGLPILSLDYKKAPEFPYPHALNECYDVYRMLVASRGSCIGMSGNTVPEIVIAGDSAGGNLATGLTLMIIETGSTDTRTFLGQIPLPVPAGLVLMYPALDMNIGSWMTDEQMSLIKDRRMRKINAGIVRRKSMQYTFTAGTPHHSGIEMDSYFAPQSGPLPPDEELTPKPPVVSSDIMFPEPNFSDFMSPQPEFSSAPLNQLSGSSIKPPQARQPSELHHPEPMKTRLALTSMLSYFGDRILTPEMMRAMIMLYIGPHNRPDFSQDHLLCPILAPDSLLAQFPKTYFLTGERDPLVDDTVIFAGRLRRAKEAKHNADRSYIHLRKEFDDRDVVEVALIPGISHGFLQFCGVFPEGWKHVFRCGRWIEECFTNTESYASPTPKLIRNEQSRHHRRQPTDSSDGEDFGLEMKMTLKDKARDERGKAERAKKESLLHEEMGKRRPGSDREMKRKKSSTSLASTDDLLGRRMQGLAGPLTGIGGSSELEGI
ncbi:Alpha/Beta hydrolase protein [Calycina marina]|uniref:Alpha/Beta hydrolase protein n=1 Tax=Calycina marina TaxID=1763456 RepID=A0A9P8CCQ8_9HELO|nr:Alpha/Beta hydrolase protein [Calycina marina]